MVANTALNLVDAPSSCKLKVISLEAMHEDAVLVLKQLGIARDEIIEKLHVAPLGDPLTVRIGGQRFSLRKEICRNIRVERV